MQLKMEKPNKEVSTIESLLLEQSCQLFSARFYAKIPMKEDEVEKFFKSIIIHLIKLDEKTRKDGLYAFNYWCHVEIAPNTGENECLTVKSYLDERKVACALSLIRGIAARRTAEILDNARKTPKKYFMHVCINLEDWIEHLGKGTCYEIPKEDVEHNHTQAWTLSSFCDKISQK